MKVEIRDYVFEGTPDEIKEYVNADREYINEMVFRFKKCPTCLNELGDMKTSELLNNIYGEQYIVHRRKCKQCNQFWAYNTKV